jgi:hypothetical protein
VIFVWFQRSGLAHRPERGFGRAAAGRLAKRRHRLRSVISVTELALALVLLVGAALLLQMFLKLRDGYSVCVKNVLILRTSCRERNTGNMHSARLL